MYKKALLFGQSIPFAFLLFSLPSPWSLLKLPIEFYKQGKLLKPQKNNMHKLLSRIKYAYISRYLTFRDPGYDAAS